MLWHMQTIFESKGDKLSSSAECRIRTQRVSETQSPTDWMPADKPTELSRIKLKTWTRQPVHMISKHSAHLTPLAFGIRTWLWRYTYLLLISMLWHKQASFESKGDIHTCIDACMHTCIRMFVVVNLFRCSGTGKRYSNRKETSCLPLLNAGLEPKVSDTYSPADWMPADKPTELSRIKL